MNFILCFGVSLNVRTYRALTQVFHAKYPSSPNVTQYKQCRQDFLKFTCNLFTANIVKFPSLVSTPFRHCPIISDFLARLFRPCSQCIIVCVPRYNHRFGGHVITFNSIFWRYRGRYWHCKYDALRYYSYLTPWPLNSLMAESHTV